MQATNIYVHHLHYFIIATQPMPAGHCSVEGERLVNLGSGVQLVLVTVIKRPSTATALPGLCLLASAQYLTRTRWLGHYIAMFLRPIPRHIHLRIVYYLQAIYAILIAVAGAMWPRTQQWNITATNSTTTTTAIHGLSSQFAFDFLWLVDIIHCDGIHELLKAASYECWYIVNNNSKESRKNVTKTIAQSD